MIYAANLTNSEKIQAEKGKIGYCLLCKNKLLSKCGEINVWHWAHESDNEKKCDSWYESETEWHLNWKTKFSKDNCEVIIENENIKHIADIQTNNGTIIEIQHSTISSKVIKERENFYKKMVWVIDGIKFKNNINFDYRYSIKNDMFEIIKNYKISVRKEFKKSRIRDYETDEMKEYNSPIYYFGFDRIPEIKLRELLKKNKFSWLPELKEWKCDSINQYNRFVIKAICENKQYIYFTWDWARKTWQFAKCPVYIDLGDVNLFEMVVGTGTSFGYGNFISKKEFIEKYS